MRNGEVRGENPSNTKTTNLAVVLEAIRQQGPVSRTELTNLLDDHQFAIIGIEIARTNANVLLLTLTGRIMCRASLTYKAVTKAEQLIKDIGDQVAMLLAQATELSFRVIGIGVGVPGPVDTRRGVVTSPPNFPGWRNVPLGSALQERFGLPTLLDDDAKTAALGESLFGAGVGSDSMVYISVGIGIGAGVILNGKLYRGMHDVAGEIGHVTVDVFGPRCECGNIGCLEDMAAIPALYRYAISLAEDGCEPGLTPEQAQGISLADLCNPLLHPEIATRLLYHATRYLSAGLILAINTYDPERIVVGGDIFESCPGLLDNIKAEVRNRTFGVTVGRVEIVERKLGYDTTAVGAAALILTDALSHPTNYFT